MIDLSHAYKVYPGPVQALKDVSLTVDKGEFVFLMGPSGSGKTTLFRLLSAYDKPTSGFINVLGTNITQLNDKTIPYFRRQIGVVYQDFRLLKGRTIFENVSMPLEVKGERERYIQTRTDEVLHQVGLLHKKYDYPEQLSGGEQQRVAIARALVHHPGLLIADEPTGNLDADRACEIIELLNKINAQGTTVFVATHDQQLVQKHPRRIIRLQSGIITEGASA